MFPSLPAAKLSSDAIDDLVEVMSGAPAIGDNPRIPAGYTYLGQFIDHDITFDPTSRLQKDNDPDAIVNFRTPRVDLDSLYGAGPADQPYLYESRDVDDRGIKLLVGDDDLPRNAQDRALIGDPRNDENLILAQLHLLFIRFHNRVVDHVRAERRLAGDELLREAQRIVRWHFQWIVGHEFLRHIVGDGIERRFFRWEGDPFIPVEFSGAAYRFGHSMIRGSYRLNEATEDPVTIFARDDDPQSLEHLGGFRRIPAALRIDWKFFFGLQDPPRPQLSRRIDTSLSGPLFRLPEAVSSKHAALAHLNLRRGRALGLPSGRDVALAMGVEPLSDEELLLDGVAERSAGAVLSAPPLWYYVLCEASSMRLGDNGRHLGPVGGRIVLEVLTGLLDSDPNGYQRRWPAWTPELSRATESDFTMIDLINFVG